MQYVTLGKTGLKISRVGFGGIPIQRIDAEKAKPLIDALIECGINYIDTARGYTVSEDGLHFVVTLREGLKWSDGSDLTAADFEYSWKRAAATDTAADYGYMFAGIEGYPDELNVKAVDDTTFEFVLTAPCAYMEDLMAFPTFFPV